MKTLLSSVGIVFCAALPVLADTLTLTPSADTTLFQNFPDNNLGGVTMLAAGTTAHGFLTRALIKFDVAGQIPPGSTVTSARLRVTVSRAPLGAQPSTFSLRRVLRDWGEGDKSVGTLGDVATEGEANWTYRFYDVASWQTPGGAPGVDFSNTSSSSAPSATGGTMLFNTSVQMVADVQSWLQNPGQNFGWLVISGSEQLLSTARRLASREDPNSAPALEIQYAPPFRIDNVALSDGSFHFSFHVEPLFTYTVESRTFLGTGTWGTLTNFSERLSSYEATISDPATGPSRFYRVLKAPCNCP